MHNSQAQHFHLDTPQQSLVLHVIAGDMVQVTQGSIWLTLEGHSRDVWLKAHEPWTVPLDAKAWISAEGVAVFTVSQQAVPRVNRRKFVLRQHLPVAVVA